jgi:ubiquinone/menaquinone biosynthesis C-methylase UbiE
VSRVPSNDYDAVAEAYAQDNESNAWNAHYERPAVLAMLGDVAGRRVLDAGCGAGAHAAELVARGARVAGVDSSGGLLALAARRLDPRAWRSLTTAPRFLFLAAHRA